MNARKDKKMELALDLPAQRGLRTRQQRIEPPQGRRLLHEVPAQAFLEGGDRGARDGQFVVAQAQGIDRPLDFHRGIRHLDRHSRIEGACRFRAQFPDRQDGRIQSLDQRVRHESQQEIRECLKLPFRSKASLVHLFHKRQVSKGIRPSRT